MQERRKLPPETIGAVVMNYKNKAEGYLSGSESFFPDLEDEYKEIRGIQRHIGELKVQMQLQNTQKAVQRIAALLDILHMQRLFRTG